MKMKTYQIKSMVVLSIAFMLMAVPSAWAAMMGGGGMGGGGSTTTTIIGGGGTGGGMMYGGGRMSQLKIADLDGDNIPEIVSIASGNYLIIMDNEGNVKTSKPLPRIPGQTYQSGMTGGLDIADLDGDGTPEIVTTYYVTNYGYMFRPGTATKIWDLLGDSG